MIGGQVWQDDEGIMVNKGRRQVKGRGMTHGEIEAHCREVGWRIDSSSSSLGDSGTSHVSQHSGHLSALPQAQSLMPNTHMGCAIVRNFISRAPVAPFCPILQPGMQLLLRTHARAKQLFTKTVSWYFREGF